DRDEAVGAVGAGEAAPGTREVRVERRRMLIDLVAVAAGRVRLPDLDELPRERPPGVVEQPPAHDDALRERVALVLARQVAVGLADRVVAEHRAVERVELLGQRHERPLRDAQACRAVAGIVELYLGPEVGIVGQDDRRLDGRHAASSARSASSSRVVGGSLTWTSSATRNVQPVASRACSTDADGCTNVSVSSPSRGSSTPRSVTTTRTRSPTLVRKSS